MLSDFQNFFYCHLGRRCRAATTTAATGGSTERGRRRREDTDHADERGAGRGRVSTPVCVPGGGGQLGAGDGDAEGAGERRQSDAGGRRGGDSPTEEKVGGGTQTCTVLS